MIDVLVIGAGPAGLSAAINVRARGGSVLVLGSPRQDNPLYKAEKIDNYLGMPGLSGKEMMEQFIAHAKDTGVEIKEARVLSAMKNGSGWMVSAGADVYEAGAVVLTGGVVRGKALPGEVEFLGKGVSYCATCDGMMYRNREVVVLGYGEEDEEEAEFLKSIGCKVTFIAKPKNVKIKGDGLVNAIEADGQEYLAECVFILRPSVAPTQIFPELELDGNYVKVDRSMRTNLDGLYAAGDCTGIPLQVAKAVGEGLVAGQSAIAWTKAKQKK